jgi:hypothetical protein
MVLMNRSHFIWRALLIVPLCTFLQVVLSPQVSQAEAKPGIAPVPLSGSVTAACGTASGTRFNLEPPEDPVPQNGTSVDFLPGQGLSGGDLVVGSANDFRLFTPVPAIGDFLGEAGLETETGYYVHRNGTDSNPCSPDFEGGLPVLTDSKFGDTLVGAGDPVVAADSVHRAFFIADIRGDNSGGDDSAIGLFRSTAANLNDPALCPAGTQTQSQSATCWPTGILVNLGHFFNPTSVKPELAVDQRASGTGSGDVYISATESGMSGGNFYQDVYITACKNDLSACSSSVVVSGKDKYGDLSNLSLRPDGGVTLTYTVFHSGGGASPAEADIKYVACTPNGAPKPVTCQPATLVTHEKQAIPFDIFIPGTGLEAAQFVLHTFPKHTHRQDQNGIETYVVWERCKVSTVIKFPGLAFDTQCPDADLVMAASNDNGQTWHFANVDVGPQDQFQPAVSADPSTNIVNIAYYSSQADPFQHRAKVLLRQILPGASTPDPVTNATAITTIAMDPNTDPFLQGIFIGYYIGVSARGVAGGSRAYIHYMHTAVPGIYNGVSDPEQNNHLSSFDY